MNKISKYRSWDKIERNMCYGNEEEAVSWHSGAISPAIVVINSLLKERRERYEYMQYIGVDDRNGKEIYEGDIVKRKTFCDYVIGQVVWLDIGFCGFMLKCRNSYYHIGKSEHTGISVCDEVIGNVYENADLLKEVE